jgi:hypothetical protein
MPNPPADPRWLFELHAAGGGQPDPLRVRQILKALGRRYGLKVSWPASEPRAHEPVDPGAVAMPSPSPARRRKPNEVRITHGQE